MTDLSRRAFLAVAGTGLGAAWLAARPEDVAGAHEHADAARRAAARGEAPPPLEVLTPEQAADIEAVASRIIPTDDLPGAREAHVIQYVDRSLATWAADQREPLLAGLARFNRLVARRHRGRSRFAELTADQQLAFLSANARDPFFQQARDLTILGMFANPSWGGNFEGAGWRVLGFEPRYAWQPPFGEYDAEPPRGN